ncbi:acid protease [Meredithblackwellia eburnea MCA 4105]
MVLLPMAFLATAATLLVPTQAFHQNEDGVYSTPLYRRSADPPGSYDELIASRLGYLEDSKAKYGYNNPSRRLSKRSSVTPASGQISLGGQYDAAFGELSVGTPPLRIEVLFDTGSSDLLLVTTQTGCKPNCTYTGNLYNPQDSSTAQVTSSRIDLKYGIGESIGNLVYDTVTLAGFTSRQGLVAADNNVDFSNTPEKTGLLGVAWAKLAKTGEIPFIQALWQAGRLKQPLFGFALAKLAGPASSNKNVQSGGYFTVGATNTSLYQGDIHWINKGTTGYWDIPLQGLSAAGYNFGIDTSVTIMDTGTNSILLDAATAQSIYSVIPGGGPIKGADGLYAYPCNATIDFTLQFNGYSYHLPDSYFNWGNLDEEWCVGAVTSMSIADGASAPWIIGTPFLEAFYTAWRFDPPAVGLAVLNDVNGILEKSPIPSSTGPPSETYSNNIEYNGPGSKKSTWIQPNCSGGPLKCFTRNLWIVIGVGAALVLILFFFIIRCLVKRRSRATKYQRANRAMITKEDMMESAHEHPDDNDKAPLIPGGGGMYHPPQFAAGRQDQQYNNPYDPSPPLAFGGAARVHLPPVAPMPQHHQ